MNEQGALFGGYLLLWLDEFAYITACIDYRGNCFVTMGLKQVEFKHPIVLGEILRFSVIEARKGTTSVEYLVEVFGEKEAASDRTELFATRISFVNIQHGGNKTPIKPTD